MRAAEWCDGRKRTDLVCGGFCLCRRRFVEQAGIVAEAYLDQPVDGAQGHQLALRSGHPAERNRATQQHRAERDQRGGVTQSGIHARTIPAGARGRNQCSHDQDQVRHDRQADESQAAASAMPAGDSIPSVFAAPHPHSGLSG